MIEPRGCTTASAVCLHKRINGKMRRLTIGRFGVVLLTEAHERALDLIEIIAACRDLWWIGISTQQGSTR